MVLVKKTKLSIIGVSIVGSIFHSIGQVLVGILVLNNYNITYYLPYLLIFSISLIAKKMLHWWTVILRKGEKKNGFTV